MEMRTHFSAMVAGLLLASGAQAVPGNEGQVPGHLLLAQASGTAAAAGAGAGTAAAPVSGGNAATAPRSTGTAGTAGTGAGTAASPGPATGRTNAATIPGVPASNRPGTGANNTGVTPGNSTTTGAAANAVPPADINTPLPGNGVVIVPPPNNGVIVRDPMNPDGSSSLDDAEAQAQAQRIHPRPREPAGDYNAAIQSCQGLPGAEKPACEREARRIHGRM